VGELPETKWTEWTLPAHSLEVGLNSFRCMGVQPAGRTCWPQSMWSSHLLKQVGPGFWQGCWQLPRGPACKRSPLSSSVLLYAYLQASWTPASLTELSQAGSQLPSHLAGREAGAHSYHLSSPCRAPYVQTWASVGVDAPSSSGLVSLPHLQLCAWFACVCMPAGKKEE